MRYTAYGLDIDNDMSLGELLPEALSPSSAPPDVQIRVAEVEEARSAGAAQVTPFVWARPGTVWVDVPGVGRYRVRDGHEILVQPDPAADLDSMQLFLLGSPLGALLFQRGYLVLHGNAIRVGDQCMVCIGPSGAGKSTLAAAFLRRGHAVLADDVVPVDADGRALGGYPRIKLWQDAADRLEIATPALRPVRSGLQKFHVPVQAHLSGDALPVRWIYLLENHALPEIRVEPLAGLDRFEPLRQNTYRVNFLPGMGLAREHLLQCAALAGRVRLARVTRPRSGFALEELVDRLLADMAAHP